MMRTTSCIEPIALCTLGHTEAAAHSHNIEMSAEENSKSPEVLQRVLWIQTLALIWMSAEAGCRWEQLGRRAVQ